MWGRALLPLVSQRAKLRIASRHGRLRQPRSARGLEQLRGSRSWNSLAFRKAHIALRHASWGAIFPSWILLIFFLILQDPPPKFLKSHFQILMSFEIFWTLQFLVCLSSSVVTRGFTSRASHEAIVSRVWAANLTLRLASLVRIVPFEENFLFKVDPIHLPSPSKHLFSSFSKEPKNFPHFLFEF